MLSLTAWATRVPVGLATPALVVDFILVQAAGLTLAQAVVPTLAPMVVLIPAPAVALTLAQVAVPILAQAVGLTPAQVAVPILAQAVEHPQAQGEVAMLAQVGATLINGTAQIQTVSDTCN